jgi:hypothetical protein
MPSLILISPFFTDNLPQMTNDQIIPNNTEIECLLDVNRILNYRFDGNDDNSPPSDASLVMSSSSNIILLLSRYSLEAA